MKDDGLPWKDIGKVADDLIKSLKFAYKLTRQNKGKNIPYNGRSFTSYKITSLQLDDHLTLEGQEYNQGQGRTPLDSIIMGAIQLGIEQGFRFLGDASVGDEEAKARKRQEDDEAFDLMLKVRDTLRDDGHNELAAKLSKYELKFRRSII